MLVAVRNFSKLLGRAYLNYESIAPFDSDLVPAFWLACPIDGIWASQAKKYYKATGDTTFCVD